MATLIRKRLEHQARDASFYVPEFKGPFVSFTRRFVRDNLWKVQRTCTFDDAMQEARIVFLLCERRYVGTVDNPAWFMTLYKRALENQFVDLSNRDTKYREAIAMADLMVDDDSELPEAVGELANEGELSTALRQAPSEVRQVLALLLNAPSEILDAVGDAWRSQGRKSVFGNPSLCRLLGLPEGSDPLGAVRNYFGEKSV